MVEWDEDETEQMSFLTIVLSLILCHSHQLSHRTLASYLKKIDNELNIDKAPWDEEIKALVTMGYLDRFKIKATDDDDSYTWGTRSKILYSQESIVEFIADVIFN